MAIQRTHHAVYDLKYHLVWIPKYRKSVLKGEVAVYVKAVFHQIAEQYEMKIDVVEVVEDHVHMLIYAPPRYSPSQIVQRMKSISAREVFRKFPQVKAGRSSANTLIMRKSLIHKLLIVERLIDISH